MTLRAHLDGETHAMHPTTDRRGFLRDTKPPPGIERGIFRTQENFTATIERLYSVETADDDAD